MKRMIFFTSTPHHHYNRQMAIGIMHSPQFEGSWWLCIRYPPQTLTELDAIIAELSPHGAFIHGLTSPMVRRLLDAKIPCVSVSVDWHPSVDIPVIKVNERIAGKMVAEHFLAQGFVNFGSVALTEIVQFSERQRGFQERLSKQKHKCALFRIYDNDDPFSTATPTSELVSWIQQLPKPCAILASHDAIGALVLNSCHRAGIRVPEEVSVIGIENFTLICLTTCPHLSSVQLPFEEIGREAAKLLCSCDPSKPPRRFVKEIAPTEIVIRDSAASQRTGDSVVTRALKFIEQHIDQPFKIADIQAYTNVSAPTLAANFKREIGRTAIEEVRHQRINRAKCLLAETDDSLEVIAKKSGFKSDIRLCGVFRELTGYTPLAYRRSARSA